MTTVEMRGGKENISGEINMDKDRNEFEIINQTVTKIPLILTIKSLN